MIGIRRSFWSISLTIGIYLVILVSLWATRPQFCIESSVVEKLDIRGAASSDRSNDQLLGEQSLSVYGCEYKQKSKYSDKLQGYIDQIDSRLEQLSLVLNKVDQIKNKIHITIDEKNPLSFSVEKNRITIGTGLLESRGHLERGVIKSWLKSNLNVNDFAHGVFTEAIADLIYYAVFGKFDLYDPVGQLYPKIGTAKWPQVLKNLDSYCESSWKLSEDFATCASLNSEIFNKNADRKQILTVSLRPLLTSALIAAFEDLSFKDQNKLLQQIPKWVGYNKIDSDKAIEYLLDQDNALKEGLSIVRVFADQFSVDDYVNTNVKSEGYLRQFVTGMNQYLQQQGVADSFAEAYFDYLVEFPDTLTEKSNLFKSLEKAAIQNLNLQIAVKDAHQIWILPSRSGLSHKIFDKIKVRQHIYFACPILKEISMNQFLQNTEKMLLIKGCDSQRNYAFDLLFKFGVPEFTKKESNLAFIQFHIPSLEQHYMQLQHVKNFFELVKNRDITQSEFQKLGWFDIHWNEEYKYYRPKAAVDAIEYFRVDTPQKN